MRLHKVEAYNIIIIIFILGFFAARVLAEDSGNYTSITVEPGLEVIRAGSANVLAPEGSRITKRGSQLTVEDMYSYTGRKVEELDSRVTSLESQQAGMQEDIEELKALVNSLKNTTLSYRSKE